MWYNKTKGFLGSVFCPTLGSAQLSEGHMSKKTVGVLLFATCFVLAASIQAQDNPGIKKVPAARVSPAAGKEMFTHYCASCHGKEGKGNSA